MNRFIILYQFGEYIEVEVILGPTASWSWCQVPIWDPRPILLSPWIFFGQLRFCNFVAPSLTRGRVCNLLYNCFWALPEQSLLGWSPAELTAIFYCLIWDSPNLEGQVPVFISPRNRVAQLYPWALGFLSVASYDSQGYSGGILTRLYMGLVSIYLSHGFFTGYRFKTSFFLVYFWILMKSSNCLLLCECPGFFFN
jgi:hypothetical protein